MRLVQYKAVISFFVGRSLAAKGNISTKDP
jgi:hypothetical protein